MQTLSPALQDRIETLGFSSFGIVDLDSLGDQYGHWLERFIAGNYHGSMAWMQSTALRRSHPQNLWPAARSALVLGFNYGPDTNPMANLTHPDKATISVYARGDDYHELIKGKLKELAGLLARDTKEDVKVFVDTAPLMEKPLAALAGIGWQGKHTNLVSHDFGSWLFLGVILSAAKLAPLQAAGEDRCGSCRACLDICPTNAFPKPYQMDARKCISYLTIEHKGPVEEALRAKMGNRIYGCDDCLAVCPWNKFAQSAREIKLQARAELVAPPLRELAALSDADFRKKFAKSPIKRIGLPQFLRNVLYAIGNSGDPGLQDCVRTHLTHDNPVVRDAARWAQARLAGCGQSQ